VSPPYPNPVAGNGPVYFNVQAPAGSTVSLDVFTPAFRRIAWDSQTLSGNATLDWDLRDHWDTPAADGLYYLRVRINHGAASTTKILKVLLER
jgi:hypothetical protein